MSDPSDRRILFVCTGNVCRSPMAEYLLRDQAPDGAAWAIGSAGVATEDGMPASGNAVAAMRELRIDIGGHRSRRLSAELVDEAYIILAMTRTHKEAIIGTFPVAADKVYLLRYFGAPGGDFDIADPIGGPIDVYRATRDEIGRALPHLVKFLETDLG